MAVQAVLIPLVVLGIPVFSGLKTWADILEAEQSEQLRGITASLYEAVKDKPETSAEMFQKIEPRDIDEPKKAHVTRSTRSKFRKQSIEIEKPVLTQERSFFPVEPYDINELYDRSKAMTITVLNKKTQKIELMNNNFFVTRIDLSHTEDLTLIKGNEGFTIYPFGEQPQTFVISGLFVEGENVQQFSTFFLQYLEMLRLKKAFDTYKIIISQPPLFFIEGYFITLQYAASAEFEGVITFSGGFLVTSRMVPAFIRREGKTVPAIIYYELSERRKIVSLEEILRNMGYQVSPRPEDVAEVST